MIDSGCVAAACATLGYLRLVVANFCSETMPGFKVAGMRPAQNAVPSRTE